MYKQSDEQKAAGFYDNLSSAYDELHFKKKKGAKHLTGVDIEGVIPKEGEVRLLGNRNNYCSYYTIGKFCLR